MEKPIEEGAEFKHAGRQGGRDGGGLVRLKDLSEFHIDEFTIGELGILADRLRVRATNTITTLQVPPRS